MSESLKLSEIQIGNLFHRLGTIEVVVTGVHISGRIQVADVSTKEVDDLESFKKLSPIFLPTAANMEIYLDNTEFRKVNEEWFKMNFNDYSIELKYDILGDTWSLSYYNGDIDFKVCSPIRYVHELQNMFGMITKSKLSFI